MKDLSFFIKIFMATKPVDFRRQTRSLSLFVKEALACDPLEGRSLFVFTNKRRDAIRLLYWDLTGFAMWGKILEKDRFSWPKKFEGDKIVVSSHDLKLLLQGIDLAKIKKHTPLDFRVIS
jgi:transposase